MFSVLHAIFIACLTFFMSGNNHERLDAFMKYLALKVKLCLSKNVASVMSFLSHLLLELSNCEIPRRLLGRRTKHYV